LVALAALPLLAHFRSVIRQMRREALPPVPTITANSTPAAIAAADAARAAIQAAARAPAFDATEVWWLCELYGRALAVCVGLDQGAPVQLPDGVGGDGDGDSVGTSTARHVFGTIGRPDMEATSRVTQWLQVLADEELPALPAEVRVAPADGSRSGRSSAGGGAEAGVTDGGDSATPTVPGGADASARAAAAAAPAAVGDTLRSVLRTGGAVLSDLLADPTSGAAVPIHPTSIAAPAAGSGDASLGSRLDAQLYIVNALQSALDVASWCLRMAEEIDAADAPAESPYDPFASFVSSPAAAAPAASGSHASATAAAASQRIDAARWAMDARAVHDLVAVFALALLNNASWGSLQSRIAPLTDDSYGRGRGWALSIGGRPSDAALAPSALTYITGGGGSGGAETLGSALRG